MPTTSPASAAAAMPPASAKAKAIWSEATAGVPAICIAESARVILAEV